MNIKEGKTLTIYRRDKEHFGEPRKIKVTEVYKSFCLTIDPKTGIRECYQQFDLVEACKKPKARKKNEE